MALFSSRVSTPFQIFVQGIIDLYGNGPEGRKKFLDHSRISQRASKGKQTIAKGIFTPFGVQCKVILQGFAQKARKKRTLGISTPSGIQ